MLISYLLRVCAAVGRGAAGERGSRADLPIFTVRLIWSTLFIDLVAGEVGRLRSMGPGCDRVFRRPFDEAAGTGRLDETWVDGVLIGGMASPSDRRLAHDNAEAAANLVNATLASKGEARPVPCPPPLTTLLRDHMARHGTAADGRLFRNLTGGDLAESTVARAWSNARQSALTAEEFASPLTRRPYDLRHACVSTWLSSGVPSTQVAEWAGHSVAVLHQIYAKVLAGQEPSARERIERALGLWADDLLPLDHQ